MYPANGLYPMQVAAGGVCIGALVNAALSVASPDTGRDMVLCSALCVVGALAMFVGSVVGHELGLRVRA